MELAKQELFLLNRIASNNGSLPSREEDKRIGYCSINKFSLPRTMSACVVFKPFTTEELLNIENSIREDKENSKC